MSKTCLVYSAYIHNFFSFSGTWHDYRRKFCVFLHFYPIKQEGNTQTQPKRKIELRKRLSPFYIQEIDLWQFGFSVWKRWKIGAIKKSGHSVLLVTYEPFPTNRRSHSSVVEFENQAPCAPCSTWFWAMRITYMTYPVRCFFINAYWNLPFLFWAYKIPWTWSWWVILLIFT